MSWLVEWSIRVSVLMSMCLFAIGLTKLGVVIYVESRFHRLVMMLSHKVGLPVGDLELSGISEALHGIEYLFLAPLPFIVFASAVRYIARSFERGKDEQSAALIGESEIVAAKRSVIGLIVGTIGAVCISRLTTPEGLPQGEGLGMAAVIVALALYVRLSRE
jgi:hypothetical protein